MRSCQRNWPCHSGWNTRVAQLGDTQSAAAQTPPSTHLLPPHSSLETRPGPYQGWWPLQSIAWGIRGSIYESLCHAPCRSVIKLSLKPPALQSQIAWYKADAVHVIRKEGEMKSFDFIQCVALFSVSMVMWSVECAIGRITRWRIISGGQERWKNPTFLMSTFLKRLTFFLKNNCLKYIFKSNYTIHRNTLKEFNRQQNIVVILNREVSRHFSSPSGQSTPKQTNSHRDKHFHFKGKHQR